MVDPREDKLLGYWMDGELYGITGSFERYSRSHLLFLLQRYKGLFFTESGFVSKE